MEHKWKEYCIYKRNLLLCNEKCLYLISAPVRTAGTVWFNSQTALPCAGAVARELWSISLTFLNNFLGS